LIRIILLLILVVGGQFERCGSATASPPAQRIRPPESLKCPRNRLTSFSGAVLELKRGGAQTSLRMKTDENTVEKFTWKHAGKKSPEEWFLLRTRPFESGDWSKLQTKSGKLRTGMRATVWVCDDGSPPVVDWQPPQE
jgi:hypothetical protein